jgi:hypothetical protein
MACSGIALPYHIVTTRLVDESGMIRYPMGRTIDQKWSQCKGHLVRLLPNSNSNAITKVHLCFLLVEYETKCVLAG